MTRVIHTGDTHLGYRQYHSPERRDDFLAAFRQVVEDAITDDVDALVHAGDLFHDRSPNLADVHGAIRLLRDLRDAGVPFLAVVGNHEQTRGGQWLDLFHTLGLATRLGDEPTVVGVDGDAVAFYGLDYVPPSRRDDLDYEFAAHDADFAALVAHGPFDPFVPEVRNDRWDLPAALEASSVDFDVALLGDDHTADTVEIDGTWATYCGSTERVDASERDDRGYNLVEFDGSERGPSGVRISRRGLETRRFVLVDLTLEPGEGLERVRERVREEDVADAVVVVRIEGDGEEVHPARVEEFATERGALIARVSDRRDVEAAEDVPEVSFADPDEAVRERVGELGLSVAAAAIDATVRDDGVADANVRNRVRERVEVLLDEDPDALEPVEVEATAEDDGAADTDADADGDAADGDAPNEDGDGPATDDAEGEDAPPGPTPSVATANGGANEYTETAEASESNAAEDVDESEHDDEPERTSTSGDGATTIEDFL